MTHRLVRFANDNWMALDGWAASQNVDPLDLGADRFLSLVYHFATKDGDEAGIDKFDARLWMPPVGVAAVKGPWTAEAETSAFRAFAAEVTQK